MKTVIISALALTTIFYNSFSQDNISEPQYILLKKDKNITLWYRWILLSDKRTTRELKAEFIVSAIPDQVLSVLRNDKLALQWMQGVKEFNHLNKASENCWFTYLQYEIPWPLSNQDCIIRYNLQINGKDKGYYISLTGEPGYIPAKQGVTRIPHLRGNWKIVPLGSKQSKVAYTIYSAQKPTFPRWITDPLIQNNLIKTMQAFNEITEKK